MRHKSIAAGLVESAIFQKLEVVCEDINSSLKSNPKFAYRRGNCSPSSHVRAFIGSIRTADTEFLNTCISTNENEPAKAVGERRFDMACFDHVQCFSLARIFREYREERNLRMIVVL
jgi:hypothetical protein